MTERERLIKLLMQGELEADKQGVFNCSRSEWKAEIMADFLLENGVIVPPVKVGDTVYIIERGNYIIPLCGHCKPHWEKKIEKCSFKYWMLDNHKFGENIFLTREEAEKALAERSKHSD